MLLNGWKEIASYLKTSVRTVQRWEVSGLPIVRPSNGARGAVIAYSEQVDQWLRRRRDGSLTVSLSEIATQRARLVENLERARLLAAQLGEARDRMQSQIQDLYASVSALRRSRALPGAPAAFASSVSSKNAVGDD